MDQSRELERRAVVEAPGLQVNEDENGRTVIRGYAALYRSESQPMGFIETIEPGAFDKVIESNPDVFGRYNHDRLLARTSSGTLKLELDERGLRYTIYPKPADADVIQSLERGDVRGSSFAFRLPADGSGERWYKDKDGRTIREIRSIEYLGDVGPVDNPAYPATEAFVSKRALELAASFDESDHSVPDDAPVVVEDAEARAEPGELEVGDFVEWNSSGGVAMGRIDRIVTDGEIEVPDTDVVIKGEPDNPAAMITVYDEAEPTEIEVAHRFSALTKIGPPVAENAEDMESEERAVNLKPTAGMAANARRGLRLHEEGKSGDGLKPETVMRANKLADREEMNRDWVVEMNAWFKRHASDKRPGWDEPGSETPGFTAWLLWGGDDAARFSERKAKELEAEGERSNADDNIVKRDYKHIASTLRATVAASKLRDSLARR